MSLLIEDEMTE